MEYTELTLGVDETRNLALVYPLLYQNSINLAVDQTSDIVQEVDITINEKLLNRMKENVKG